MRYLSLWLQITLMVASVLLSFGTAFADSNQLTLEQQRALSSKYWLARPVYLEIRAINDDQSVLTRKQIADMASHALDKFGESAILMSDNIFPDKVRVLRIMYVVHEQPTDRGEVIAASAKVELLRTAADQYSTVLATSIYSGLQQSLTQAADQSTARQQTREAFERSLDKRIVAAFTNTAAQ